MIMKQTVEEAAREYANENCWIPEELHDSEIPDYMEHFAKHFIAGAKWANENKEKPKVVCLRDKAKRCNLCHECDVDVLNPSY